MLLSRPPLDWHHLRSANPARLACIRHAASVYPEPGSNSPKKTRFSLTSNPRSYLYYHSSVVKVRPSRGMLSYHKPVGLSRSLRAFLRERFRRSPESPLTCDRAAALPTGSFRAMPIGRSTSFPGPSPTPRLAAHSLVAQRKRLYHNAPRLSRPVGH